MQALSVASRKPRLEHWAYIIFLHAFWSANRVQSSRVADEFTVLSVKPSLHITLIKRYTSLLEPRPLA